MCVCVIFFASCMQLYDVVVANHVELLNQQPLLCHRLYGYAADHVYMYMQADSSSFEVGMWNAYFCFEMTRKV